MLKKLTTFSLIIGTVAIIFSLVTMIIQLSFSLSLILFLSILFFGILSLRIWVKETLKDGVRIFFYPILSYSKLSLYSLYAIPVLIIGVCYVKYHPVQKKHISKGETETNRISYNTTPCDSNQSVDRSICIAKFSPETFDGFSQSLILELSEKIDPVQLRLIDHDKFVYSGRNEKKQIDSIQLTNCIDTGIIVHGYRSSEAEVFYCKVHFLNYQRNDTLINNPDKIEFSYIGHSKYLSSFLLAQNESSKQKYRYALNLFLDSKLLGEGIEFNSIIDYYIGNMYFNLNNVDSARIYYKQAGMNPSSVQDFALSKLSLAEPGLKKYMIAKDSPSKDSSKKRRSRIKGMLNSQFRSHSSHHFQVKKLYEDSVRFGEFVEITADTWQLERRNRFLSKWLLLRYDSLYYFEMRTRIYDDDSDIYQFTSSIKKVWSIPVKRNLRCVLNRSGQTWQDGWDVDFLYSKDSHRKVSKLKVHYDWFYYQILSGHKPYKELKDYSWEFEIGRVERIKEAISKILVRAGINVGPVNKIDFNEIKINELE